MPEKKDVEKSENRKRDVWDNPLEFLFSCISLSVGLGNIWRFPFTAYENGGGAFLVPYLIVLFLVGKPIYFMELALGQFSSYGPVKIWKMAPILKGVGYGEVLASVYCSSYYSAIMAITIYYLFNSFSSVLPWSQCDPSWAGDCGNGNLTEVKKNLPELYYMNQVTKQKANIDDGIGAPDLALTLCLLLAWILTFVTLVKGIKSSGKFAYVFAVLPYVVLLTLLVRGVTLPGAWEGIKYFILPDWSKLLEIKVWYAAVVQCFFSLGMGFGPIIMNASFNSFRHNVYRDAMVISIMDTVASLLAGFTIFSILGHLAFQMGLPVQDVANTGPGLAFISYPMAVAEFTFLPQIFAILFFIMMLTLGIGSATVVTNAIITNICDVYPKLNRFIVTGVVCFVGFLLGLIYVTPGGQFMVTLVDSYGASFGILLMATLEVIGVVFIYGLKNFAKDIEFMLGLKISWYWRICWGLLGPVALVAILGTHFITWKEVKHNDVSFPTVATVFGVLISLLTAAAIPICAAHAIYKQKSRSGFLAKLAGSAKPSSDWGPMDTELKQEWREFKSVD